MEKSVFMDSWILNINTLPLHNVYHMTVCFFPQEKTTTTTSHHTDSTESDQDLQISHPRFGFNKHGEKVFINKCGDEIVYQEVQQGLPSASGKIVKLSDLRAKGQNAESKAWKVAGPRD